MKKYVVNKDGQRRELTDADIQRYKDFTQVKQKYQRLTHRPKPLYKDPKAFLGLVLIVIILWIIFSDEFDAPIQSDQDTTEEVVTE